MARPADSTEYLSTLEKGLSVLNCFTRERPEMTLSEVARATKLNAAVVRRCLLTLEALGYVGRNQNQFFLKPKVLELGSQFNDIYNIDNILRPLLQRVRDKTGDSASFAVLTEGEVLYVSHASTYRVIRLQAGAGTRFPALNTSLGRAIVGTWSDHELKAYIHRYPARALTERSVTEPKALFDAVVGGRESGWWSVSDELDYGVTSIAVPIRVPGVGTVGAINCSSATSRVDLANFVSDRLPTLQDTADRIVGELLRAPVLLQSIRSMENESLAIGR